MNHKLLRALCAEVIGGQMVMQLHALRNGACSLASCQRKQLLWAVQKVVIRIEGDGSVSVQRLPAASCCQPAVHVCLPCRSLCRRRSAGLLTSMGADPAHREAP